MASTTPKVKACDMARTTAQPEVIHMDGKRVHRNLDAFRAGSPLLGMRRALRRTPFLDPEEGEPPVRDADNAAK